MFIAKALIIIAVLLLLFIFGKLNASFSISTPPLSEGYSNTLRSISGPKLYNEPCHHGYACSIDSMQDVYDVNAMIDKSDNRPKTTSTWLSSGGASMGIAHGMSGTMRRDRKAINCPHDEGEECNCGAIDYLQVLHGGE